MYITMHKIKTEISRLQSPLVKYGLAIAYTVLALMVSSLSWGLIEETPFLFFFAAVILSAWHGGFGPGMLAVVLTIGFADYFLIEPLYQFFTTPSDVVQFLIFAMVAALISWIEENRNRSESALQEARDELHIILNGVADGITVQAHDGKFIFANQASINLTGYNSPDDIVDTPIERIQQRYQMVDKNNNQIPFSSLPRNVVFNSGRSAAIDLKMKFNDHSAEDRWITIKSSPVFDKKGNVKYAVNILRDVSEHFEIEQRRSELTAIIENSGDAIIGKTLDRIITSWNPAAERLYGYTAEEAIGQHISLIFPDHIYEREMQLIHRIQAGENVKHYETQRKHKNGESIDVSLTISPIRGADGGIVGYSTIERDVGIRRQLDDLREENVRFVRNILDTMPIQVVVLTPEGMVIEVNDTALEVANLTSSDVIGQSLLHTYWWKESSTAQSQLKSALERANKGENVSIDTQIRIVDGRMQIVELNVSPMYNNDKVLTHIVVTALDITERLEREKKILRLNETSEMQRRRLDQIMANVPGIVFEATGSFGARQLRVTFISSYAEKMLGYPMEAWNNDGFWRSIIHPDDWEHAVNATQFIEDNGKPDIIQFRCYNSDGAIRHLESYASPIYDENGEYYGTCGVIMDATSRVATEAELKQINLLFEAQNQRLQNIIANLPGVVSESVVNLETGITERTYVSPYVKKMLGYSPDKWKEDASFWNKIIHPEDRDYLLKEATVAFESDKPGVAQFRCIHADGRNIHVETHFNFVQENKVAKSFAIFNDITERKEIENALAQYAEELRQSNQELEQFAYVASHDLQEPLRMVTSYLQLIEKRYADQLNEDAKEFIDFAVDGASRMKVLINDLLAYSRVQRDKLEFETVDTQQAFDRVIRNLQLSIEDNGAEITHDPLPEIEANEGQIIQLFQNLIGNAIKFRRDEAPKVHISVEERGNFHWFTVEDNGIGIEEEYLERIFVIFQRLHNRDQYPGTGIGLAICRKIVEKHGGQMQVESTVGQGTKFMFSIPIKRKQRVEIYATD